MQKSRSMWYTASVYVVGDMKKVVAIVFVVFIACAIIFFRESLLGGNADIQNAIEPQPTEYKDVPGT